MGRSRSPNEDISRTLETVDQLSAEQHLKTDRTVTVSRAAEVSMTVMSDSSSEKLDIVSRATMKENSYLHVAQNSLWDQAKIVRTQSLMKNDEDESPQPK